jgi:hypothetical protein
VAAVNTDVVSGFEETASPLRRELLAHCYRMLGSWDEAEDAVQETYLRGWRAWDGFDQRASVRTWLYLHGQPFGVAVLDIRRDAIAGITVSATRRWWKGSRNVRRRIPRAGRRPVTIRYRETARATSGRVR